MLRELINGFSVFISNISQQFRMMQLMDIKNGIVDREIFVDTKQAPLSSPYISDGKIFFSETFLNFLWVICFFLCTLTEEYAKTFKIQGPNTKRQLTPDLIKATKMLNWALVLRFYGLPWPENICSPYEKSELINYVNMVFYNSLAFIFFHEYGHAKLLHTPTKDNSISVSQERDADIFSLETIFGELPDDDARSLYLIGVICADISMLYAISNPSYIQQNSHPDIDIRMFNHLEFFQLRDSNIRRYVHKLICFGLYGFIDIYKLNLDKDRLFTNSWDRIQYYVEVIQREKIT